MFSGVNRGSLPMLSLLPQNLAERSPSFPSLGVGISPVENLMGKIG